MYIVSLRMGLIVLIIHTLLNFDVNISRCRMFGFLHRHFLHEFSFIKLKNWIRSEITAYVFTPSIRRFKFTYFTGYFKNRK